MFGFGTAEHQDAYNQVYGGQTHHSKWSHELVAGAAAFEAMKSVENGSNDKHKLSKEIFAGIAGAEADKLIETKGLDFLDSQEANRQARAQAEDIYDNNYAQYNDNSNY
ncbi:hypothetical protein BGZ49_008033 [Haplosporangium sp. Z 27]|nr:hypothetical protein BGZ49_008033 [Haplosporangium sp. Z 27]